MNTEEYMLERVAEPTWYRATDWTGQCCICLQDVARGEIVADAGQHGQRVHEKCFSAFYEA